MINKKHLRFQLMGLVFGILFIFYFQYDRGSKQAKQNWNDVVEQTNSYSCGASSLSMIFKDKGINIPLSTIEKSVLKSNSSTFLDLKKFSKTCGLSSIGWELSVRELATINMPAIISMNDSHFVVVDSVKIDSVYIRDPLRGRKIMSQSKFLKEWSGYALEFQ
ncbi:MAG: hypothetical protein JST37_04320 [Bacteroidetes bacterium]|nr:hypothetical protein [Bacteroidota bacterium]MBS1980813.1 hypothetical protein [Bacteroidota bacterium]